MWETICDARASRVWHGKIVAQIAKNTNSELSTHEYSSPPPRNEKLAITWHFEFLTTQE